MSFGQSKMMNKFQVRQILEGNECYAGTVRVRGLTPEISNLQARAPACGCVRSSHGGLQHAAVSFKRSKMLLDSFVLPLLYSITCPFVVQPAVGRAAFSEPLHLEGAH